MGYGDRPVREMEIFFIQAYNSSQKGEVLTDVRQSDEKTPTPGIYGGGALSHSAFNGAGARNRTRDLRFTKPLLYQLSYAGKLSPNLSTI